MVTEDLQMSKKGENIRKRKDGRWEARYQKGRKPDGSIQYGYVYASKYTLVKEKRNLLLASQPVQVSIPFPRIFQEWLEQIRCSVKESSYCYYDTIITTHLTPYFQKLSLQELTENVSILYSNDSSDPEKFLEGSAEKTLPFCLP